MSDSFKNSIPKTPKMNLDQASSVKQMSTHVSYKAVNTTSELDLNFQLEALTQRCVELWETENCLNNEIVLLKKKKCELEERLKL